MFSNYIFQIVHNNNPFFQSNEYFSDSYFCILKVKKVIDDRKFIPIES